MTVNKSRGNLVAVTRKVALPNGGIGKATRWMRATPRPSATGPTAGPIVVPPRPLTGVEACLSEPDARAHNASAHALRRHGIALTVTQLGTIRAGIQDSPEGFLSVWLTITSAEEPRHSTDYVGVSFTDDDGEVIRPISIAVDDFRGGGDEVNGVADRLVNFRAYGLKATTLPVDWETSGDEYGQETTGHFCDLRLAD
ncbi:hypothetical protein [Frigoribacterium sp. UYMn621]|uniref:hypothetical protein n=1 Tax=Frigoribacterium sp. UYMn621 TaxID=3156343 RepID=UPI0033980AC9